MHRSSVMKTRSGIFVFIINLLCVFLISCSDSSGGSTEPEPDIYIGGACRDSNNVSIPGYWKNGQWTGLVNPYNAADTKYWAYVKSLVVDGANVYAGGYCYDSAGVYKAGYWLNGTWHDLANSLNAARNAAVYVILLDGTDIYAGGYSNNGTVDVAGYWLNGTWNTLGGADPSIVSSMFVSGAGIYAAGWARIASSYNEGRYWKDGTQTVFTNSDSGKDGGGESLLVNGTDVYVGGYMVNSSGIAVAGYWKNGTWTPLVNSNGSYNAYCKALSVSGTDVYAGGFARNSTPANIPGYWKNSTWTPLSCAIGGDVIFVKNIDGDVYCGGSIYDSSISTACYWINGTRKDLTNSLDSTKASTVYTMVVVPSE